MGGLGPCVPHHTNVPHHTHAFPSSQQQRGVGSGLVGAGRWSGLIRKFLIPLSRCIAPTVRPLLPRLCRPLPSPLHAYPGQDNCTRAAGGSDPRHILPLPPRTSTVALPSPAAAAVPYGVLKGVESGHCHSPKSVGGGGGTTRLANWRLPAEPRR